MPTGTVKWYDPVKGYGFISREDGGDDLFVHKSAVGYAGLDEGDRVDFVIGHGPKGANAEQVSVLEKSATPPRPRQDAGGYGGGGGGSFGARQPVDPDTLAAMPVVTGTIKRYDAEKGYGFIAPDAGGEDVFVHRSAALPDQIGTGDRVEFRLGAGPKGARAEQVRVLERGAGGYADAGASGYGSGSDYY